MKAFVLLFGASLGISLVACNSADTAKNSKNTSDSTICVKPTDINPNGSSELALLMEDMFHISKKWKEQIEIGEDLGIYPVKFDQLKSAKPTKENVKNETFDPFADDFVRRTKELLEAKPEEQKNKFQLYVDGCMNCHTTMCTGPIKRIKLLHIP